MLKQFNFIRKITTLHNNQLYISIPSELKELVFDQELYQVNITKIGMGKKRKRGNPLTSKEKHQ